MTNLPRSRWVLLIPTAILASCSVAVSLDNVYGIYLREYPLGSETLTVRRDGTFTQEVNIANEPVMTVAGTWDFDRAENKITWHDRVDVVDEEGTLHPNWRTPRRIRDGVEMLWFRVEIGSGGTFPYVKQRGLD